MRKKETSAEHAAFMAKMMETVLVPNDIGHSSWKHIDSMCKKCDKTLDCEKDPKRFDLECPFKVLNDFWKTSKKSVDDFYKKAKQKVDPKAKNCVVLKMQAIVTYAFCLSSCEACTHKKGSEHCKDCEIASLLPFWRDLVIDENTGMTVSGFAEMRRNAIMESEAKKPAKKKHK